jgi:hypothetical protein
MNKIIIIEPTKKEIVRENRQIKKTQKVPIKRVITETKQWDFNNDELALEKQQTYIQQIFESNIIDKATCKIIIQQIFESNIIDKATCKIIIQQINKKINGYKAQDIKKNKFNPDKFIDINIIIKLLNECKNQCYYCKKSTNILYENVRDPCQWTLDRIDNDEGHNENNLLIACLSCNLHRKIMHTDRYVFTKQLNIIKQN